MNRKLAQDLGAWEAGKLSTGDLLLRHPAEADQVRRLTGVFSEMRSLAYEPVPDATRGWNQVRSRMAAHVAREPVSLIDRLGLRLSRRVAMGLAAALMALPAAAVAANNDTVQDGIDFVLGGIDMPFFASTGETASGEPVDESALPLDVGEGTSEKPASKTPKASTNDSGDDADESPVAPAGTDGGNVTSTGPVSSSVVPGSPASGGVAGADGGSGADGSDATGQNGESKDGADAKGADAQPTPSPTPTDGSADSASSASSPSVTSP